jgi:hypothetical protein
VRLRNILGGTVRKSLIEILNVAWLSVLDSSAKARSVSFFITARTTTTALRHINASEKYAHSLLFLLPHMSAVQTVIQVYIRSIVTIQL